MTRQELMNNVKGFRQLGDNGTMTGINCIYIVPLRIYNRCYQGFNIIVYDGDNYYYIDDVFFNIVFTRLSAIDVMLPDTVNEYKFAIPVKIRKVQENIPRLIISNY